MDFRQILKLQFDEYESETKRLVQGLTDEERRFMPSGDSHHIDFALWHATRARSWKRSSISFERTPEIESATMIDVPPVVVLHSGSQRNYSTGTIRMFFGEPASRN